MNDEKFYKKEPNDKIWWVDDPETIGEYKFTFDKKKIYNLYADYPHNMKPDEVKTFDEENNKWAEYFSDRK
ncbi:MAG: hypothetical protein IJ828_06245 [Treponema sp.]|nr:hypothetical protein [Treponema sp.]